MLYIDGLIWIRLLSLNSRWLLLGLHLAFTKSPHPPKGVILPTKTVLSGEKLVFQNIPT